MFAYLLALRVPDLLDLPGLLSDAFAFVVLLVSVAVAAFAFGHYRGRTSAELESTIRSRYRSEGGATVRDTSTGRAYHAPEF